jgi:predicted negative regulator of RcsB-dependent stress response
MAIDDLLDEHEQGERVRTWLRRNGPALVVGVALGLGAIFGWRWWQDQQYQQRIAHGDRYQDLVEAIEADDLDAAATQAAALEGTLYRTLAALKLARAQYDAGRADAAVATLQGVRGVDPSMDAVVDARLARLLIDTGKAQEAIDLLAGDDSANASEMRGDAQLALGRRDEAAESYRAALAALDEDAMQRGLLELKLSSAGAAPAGG